MIALYSILVSFLSTIIISGTPEMHFLIRISGLPAEEYNEQIKQLKFFLHKSGVRNFSIINVTNTHEAAFKQASVKLSYEQDAYLLKEFLTEVPYKKDGKSYFLRYKLDQNPGVSVTENNWCGASKRFSLENQHLDSSGPRTFDSTGEFDIEFEILNQRKRLLDEEEALLSQRENLHIMAGVGAGESSKKKYPMKKRWVPTNVDPLPMFIFPCKTLMREIRPIIRKKTQMLNERETLSQLIRQHIRKTLALALDGYTERLEKNEVVNVYRTKHPARNDEQLVSKFLDDVRAAFWPETLNAPSRKKKSRIGVGAVSATENAPKAKENPPNAKKEENAESSSTVESATITIINDAAKPVKTEVTKTENKTEISESTANIEDGGSNVAGTTVENKTEVIDITNDEPVAVPTEESSNGQSDTVALPEHKNDWVENGIGWDDDDKIDISVHTKLKPGRTPRQQRKYDILKLRRTLKRRQHKSAKRTQCWCDQKWKARTEGAACNEAKKAMDNIVPVSEISVLCLVRLVTNAKR